MYPTEIKIVAVGDGAVGKTSLLMVFNGEPFSERYVPTIFENRIIETSIENKPYNLHIWDTAGQEEFERLRHMSYNGANVILLCFSLDSRTSFDSLRNKWLSEIKFFCNEAQIVVVGTKADLQEIANRNHVKDEEAYRFVEENKLFGYCRCSPKTGEGVQNVFVQATKSVARRRRKFVCEMY